MMVYKGVETKDILEKMLSRVAFIIVLSLYLIVTFREIKTFQGMLQYGSIEAMIENEYTFLGEEITIITDMSIDKRESIKDITSKTYYIEFTSESGKLKKRMAVSKDEYSQLKVGDTYKSYYIFKHINSGIYGCLVSTREKTPFQLLKLDYYRKLISSQSLLVFVLLIGGYLYISYHKRQTNREKYIK